MLKAFQNHISSIDKKPANKKYLLAVSGGLDSVTMAEMFFLASYDFSIAHCNFQLRGKESDADEKFVKKLADKYGVPFYSIKFRTEEFCRKNKISVQMGARQLRYEWLEKIRKDNALDYIAIAHHADDSIETFFINLLRGTGIAGLHGINEVSGLVIRPLLGFYREELEKFAGKNKLAWREDRSNATDKYERNKIRHHLIPLLAKINPKAKESIRNTIANLVNTELVLNDSIEKATAKFISKKNDRILINIDLLKEFDKASLYLFELIKKYGFNFEQCLQIKEAAKKQSGKIFLTDSHRVLVDRQHLIIEPLSINSDKEVEIAPELEEYIAKDHTYLFRSRKKTKGFLIPKEPEVAVLDFDKLTFPLKIRKWEKGDKFYPIGMKGTKKVSDFLIDSKVSVFDKEHVNVLVSGGEIAWVIGYRPDDRFKVTSATKNLYLCKLEKASTHE